MTRAEAARHASLVRWGKEQPFAARLQAIRDARKQGKAKGGGKGKAPAKPKATPESRTAARNAEREKNTDATLTAVGMGDEAAGTLLSIAKGEGGGGDDFGLIKQGLVEKDTAGNLRLSSAGRTFVNAAARGDVGAARDSMSRGGDMVAHADDRAKAKGERDAARATAKQERDKAKAQRLAERDKTKAERDKARAEKAKAKSKGSKDEKPKEKPDKAAEAAQRRDTNRSSVQQALESAGGQSLNADAFSHLTAFADGKEADRGYLLGLAANTGLVEQDSAGGFRMTNEGRAYVSAANKGDTRAAGDAMSRAMDKLGGTATADAPEDDAPTARQQIREDKRRAGMARRRAGTAKNQARKSMSLSELLEERRAERYEIKQSAQDRAMFANMGTSKGGGGKGGGKPSGGQGGLWPVGKDGKRHAPEGGGGGGEAAPKAENGDKGHAWHPDDAHAIAKSGTQEFLGFSHENGNQSYVRTNVKPGKHEIVLQKKGGVTQSDTVGNTQLKQHLDAMHEKGYTAAKPIAKAEPAPRARNNNLDKQGRKLDLEAQHHRAILASAPKDSDTYKRSEARMHELATQINALHQRQFDGATKDIDDMTTDLETLSLDIEIIADQLAEAGDMAIKAGARHSSSDVAIIQEIYDSACDLCELAEQLGANPGMDDEDESDDEEATEMGGTVEMKADDIPHVFGGAIKSLDGDSIGGFAVLFGDADTTDATVQRDYFDAKTNFWLDKFGWPRPMTYHHGLDEDTADEPIVGTWTKAIVKPEGVWLEGQLDRAHRYHGAIKELVRRGFLKLSSDSAPQWVQRERQGNGANYVKRWPLISASPTVTPAEPRLSGLSFKSLLADLGLENIDDNQEANEPSDDRHDGAKIADERARRLLLELTLLSLEATA